MIDYLELSPVPADEECEQLGPNYDPTRAKKECAAFRNQLRRQFGPEPQGASLRIKGSPHDFGTYYEVHCFFDDKIEASKAYAFKCEGEAWVEWDAEARKELGLN